LYVLVTLSEITGFWSLLLPIVILKNSFYF
jgi:hypothetical protein